MFVLAVQIILHSSLNLVLKLIYLMKRERSMTTLIHQLLLHYPYSSMTHVLIINIDLLRRNWLLPLHQIRDRVLKLKKVNKNFISPAGLGNESAQPIMIPGGSLTA